MTLGVLWWAWVGYAWLTSVVDPEEGAVRIAMFGAMAGLLICALCVPGAFDDLGATFAVAYAVVRFGQIALFLLASGDTPELRRSVAGLVVSTTLGVALVGSAAFFDGWVQGAAVVPRHRPRCRRAGPVRRRGLEARRRSTSPSATA